MEQRRLRPCSHAGLLTEESNPLGTGKHVRKANATVLTAILNRIVSEACQRCNCCGQPSCLCALSVCRVCTAISGLCAAQSMTKALVRVGECLVTKIVTLEMGNAEKGKRTTFPWARRSVSSTYFFKHKYKFVFVKNGPTEVVDTNTGCS